MTYIRSYLGMTIGTASVGKYARPYGGDRSMVVGMPDGGIGCVLLDVQGSGRGASSLAGMLANQAGLLLADGASPATVVRATHERLLALRFGQVSAAIDVLAILPGANEVVIARCSPVPGFVQAGERADSLVALQDAIGVGDVVPVQEQRIPLNDTTGILLLTDGAFHAGADGQDWAGRLADIVSSAGDRNAQQIAREMLQEAIDDDSGRPRDDMTIVLALVASREQAYGVETTGMTREIPR